MASMAKKTAKPAAKTSAKSAAKKPAAKTTAKAAVPAKKAAPAKAAAAPVPKAAPAKGIAAKLMEKMVAVRDTQLLICNQSYREVKDLIREQEQREQQLTENLNLALKQLKQKRFQNRLLAAGMLFVSGIAATLYIKSAIK